MGELAIIDRTGDTKFMWDPSNADETENAKATFDKLRGKGFFAYTVDKDGEKGTQITAFDPKAGKIIMTPPMVGG